MDKERCLLALDVLNRKVAWFCRKEPRTPKFSLVPVIDQRTILREGRIVTVKTLGECNRQTGELLLLIGSSLPSTAVHELVHFYNPGWRHGKVNATTEAIIRVLKQGTFHA